jgi:hypothetical protein
MRTKIQSRSNELSCIKPYKPETMWNTNTLWFEVAIVTIFFLLGHIFFGHFEERAPKARKVLKYIVTVAIIITLSIYFGRTVAFIVLGVALLPVIYIHAVMLPSKGINGWTGEPKSKYYDFRGWDKNIFSEKNERD